MADSVIDGNLIVRGNTTITGSMVGNVSRTSNLLQELTQPFPVNLTSFRIWDAFQTNLTTAASDDLGLTAGAFGTGVPYIVSRDLNALGATTGYARTLVQLPQNYVSGGAIYLRASAGMITSAASVSASVDFEAYLHGRTNLVSGSDLVTTTATSINSTTFGNFSFTLTPTARAAGDILDIRMALICNSATASSHFAAVAAVDLLVTTQG